MKSELKSIYEMVIWTRVPKYTLHYILHEYLKNSIHEINFLNWIIVTTVTIIQFMKLISCIEFGFNFWIKLTAFQLFFYQSIFELKFLILNYFVTSFEYCKSRWQACFITHLVRVAFVVFDDAVVYVSMSSYK